METKWYSDIWQLMVAPFKRGIPQIVEHGSCRKGFYATAAFGINVIRIFKYSTCSCGYDICR